MTVISLTRSALVNFTSCTIWNYWSSENLLHTLYFLLRTSIFLLTVIWVRQVLRKRQRRKSRRVLPSLWVLAKISQTSLTSSKTSMHCTTFHRTSKSIPTSQLSSSPFLWDTALKTTTCGHKLSSKCYQCLIWTVLSIAPLPPAISHHVPPQTTILTWLTSHWGLSPLRRY